MKYYRRNNLTGNGMRVEREQVEECIGHYYLKFLEREAEATGESQYEDGRVFTWEVSPE